MKRKFLHVFLAIICLFTFTAPISVASQNDTLSSEVAAITQQMLQCIEQEKTLYGFDDIDFTALYLGNQIPSYELDQWGNIVKTDSFYFPIMNGLDWVATSIAFYNDAGKLNVQLSTQYKREYINNLSDSNKVALLFDCDSAYIVSDNTIDKIAVSPNTIPDMASIELCGNNIQLEKATLEGEYILTVEGFPAAQGFDTQHALMVPRIKQAAGSMQCWAACIASIRGYYGISTTIKDVYDKIGWNIADNQGANIYDSANVLEQYGFSLDWNWNKQFNWWQLRDAICLKECPIFASCSLSTVSGHAVVIRGFYVNQNISQPGVITYMDPAVGEYIASAVATDGDFRYVPSGSSKSYVMDAFLIVSK